MAIGNLNIGNPKNLTATANINPSNGGMLGFYVNSTTAGTIQFYDSATTTTATPLTGIITPAIGWATLPIAYTGGLYAVISGTLNVTVSYV